MSERLHQGVARSMTTRAALRFSRPAQRSLALRPACSPSRLLRPSAPEASAVSLPPLLLWLLPGGANQFPGGFTPAVDHRLFHGAPGTCANQELAAAARTGPESDFYRVCKTAHDPPERDSI